MPRVLACLFLSVLCASAQTNLDDLTPMSIAYTTTVLADGETKRIDIDVDRITRDITRIAMPNWSPGSYGIRRYGAQLTKIEAKGADGKPLSVLRTDHQTWEVNTAGVRSLRFSYVIPKFRGRFSGRGRNEKAKSTGLHYQGPNTYAYVVGAKHLPVFSTYVLPDGWKVANGLLKTDDPMRRWARDYDVLIDSPTIVGRFIRRDFEVAGTPFSCVFFANNQQYDFDVDAFVEICRKIVVNQGEIFGSFPFPNYLFLFSMSPGGGLEHLNSTSIGLSPTAMKRSVRSGAGVTSHEFFHTWNVKRIRPKTLGPFEYEHENYTGNLWVAEGWTSYYGDLTLLRTGVLTLDEYLRRMTGKIRREWNKESRKDHSVYWASRNVWHRRQGEAPRVDYYAKGEILAFLIDVKIRHATDNRLSLDDVMRFKNRWFAERNVGFEEGDVERACTAVSNHDFSPFFARHVRGTLDAPLAEILGYAGLEYTQHEISCAFPFLYRIRSGNMRVSVLRASRDEKETMPDRGDVVTAIDGRAPGDVNAFLETKKAGDRVTIAYRTRAGEERTSTVTLVAAKQVVPTLKVKTDATKKERAILESWMGGE